MVLHIFCVRLLQVCSFYFIGHSRASVCKDEQTVRLSRIIILLHIILSGEPKAVSSIYMGAYGTERRLLALTE